MEDTKPFYESKTLWFNVLAGVVAVLEALRALPEGTIPDSWHAPMLVGWTIANVVLRSFTTKPVTLR